MKTVIVAAALIIEQGRLLVTQRKKNSSHGLLWEFPGGKVKQGEDPRGALRRELKEELDVEAEVEGLFEAVFCFYPEFPILLLVYHCQIKGGIPRPLGCRDLRWTSLDDLRELTMPPADEPIRSHLLFTGAQGGGI